jgi:hypothetical protein
VLYAIAARLAWQSLALLGIPLFGLALIEIRFLPHAGSDMLFSLAICVTLTPGALYLGLLNFRRRLNLPFLALYLIAVGALLADLLVESPQSKQFLWIAPVALDRDRLRAARTRAAAVVRHRLAAIPRGTGDVAVYGVHVADRLIVGDLVVELEHWRACPAECRSAISVRLAPQSIGPLSSRNSQARAFSQSRCTVRSDMPNARAVSSSP